MNKYAIFHPVGGAMNHDCQPAVFEYTKVAVVESESLNRAFFEAQNDDLNPFYTAHNIRSTSVGDIIVASDEPYGDNVYLILGSGFRKVSPAWLTYLDWTNH